MTNIYKNLYLEANKILLSCLVDPVVRDNKVTGKMKSLKEITDIIDDNPLKYKIAWFVWYDMRNSLYKKLGY